MLGYGVFLHFKQYFINVIPSARTNRYKQKGFKSIDVTDVKSVEAFILKEKPDYVLYASGIINKIHCEENREETEAIHIHTPARIAEILSEWAGSLTYISSESVYGNEGGNYTEDSPLNPNSFYAETKVAGEQACLEANASSLILRVTPVGLTPDYSRGTLAEWACKSLREGKEISGYKHHLFTPISSSQIAKCLILSWENNLQGLYNLGSVDSLSKYDFIKGIEQALEQPVSGKVSTVKLTETPPLYQATLDSRKWSQRLNTPLPTAKEVINSLFT